MFHKILVPLDGSPLAEKALPYAVDLATRLNAQLLLLSVVKMNVMVHNSENYSLPSLIKSETLIMPHAELDFSDVTTALDYLADVKTTITDKALANFLPMERVGTLLAYDRPVSAIPEIARQEGADLIVMTTHGRGGLMRLVWGSTTVTVVRNATMPVIVMRPDEKHFTQSLEQSLNVEETALFHRPIVVTLDGTTCAEEALPPAVQMATALNTRLTMLRVVPDSQELDPAYLVATYGLAYTNEVHQANLEHRQELALYLSRLQHKISEQGVNCAGVLSHGDPEKKIIEYAERLPAEMLVMSTHAANNLTQFWQGSMATEVLQHTSLPIMLINSRLYEVTSLTDNLQPVSSNNLVLN